MRLCGNFDITCWHTSSGYGCSTDFLKVSQHFYECSVVMYTSLAFSCCNYMQCNMYSNECSPKYFEVWRLVNVAHALTVENLSKAAS